MKFAENLPDACPPPEAKEMAFNPAYRIVKTESAESTCFISHNKLGKPLPISVDACRWSSCSFFTDIDQARNIVAKLPKPRGVAQKIAKMELPEKAGLSIKKNNHVDLWFYEGFDPVTAVVDLEEVVDGA